MDGERITSEVLNGLGEGALKAKDRARKETQEAGWPAPLDLEALAEREPQPPRFLLADWLPAGEVTLLAGHGGSGKSALAIHLAVCLAAGVPWYGIGCARTQVVYVSAEDPADVLHWRLARTCAHLGVGLAALRGCLEVIDVSRLDAELMAEIGAGEPIMTSSYAALRERVGPGRVLILDGASDLYGASEIVRRHVRRYIRALRRLVDADGAVVLIAHVDKASAKSPETTTQGYSGSTAWTNSVRSRWYLRPEESDLVLELAKANYARAGAQIRLRWDADAHVYVADAPAAERGLVASIRERQERDGILDAMRAYNEPVPAAMTGPRTAYLVLAARPELPDSLRDGSAGRRTFWARIEQLRAMGAVREESIRRSDRHYVRVLVATS